MASMGDGERTASHALHRPRPSDMPSPTNRTRIARTRELGRRHVARAKCRLAKRWRFRCAAETLSQPAERIRSLRRQPAGWAGVDQLRAATGGSYEIALGRLRWRQAG